MLGRGIKSSNISGTNAAVLTVVGRWLHRVSLSSRIPDVREEVDTGLHERDLKTERIMTGSVEEMEASLAVQPVQSTIPAVQVVLIQLVCNMYTQCYVTN